MAGSIGHNLGSLARFSGRDRQRMFWPYAITVALLTVVGGGIAGAAYVVMEMIPIMQRRLSDIGTIPDDQAETVVRERMSGMMSELTPVMTNLIWFSAALTVLSILLLAASVTRRLHDAGRSAFLGLIPLPFIAISFAMFPSAMQQAMSLTVPDRGSLILSSVLNLGYYGSLIALIVLLCGQTQPQPNRHGDPPAP